MKYSNFFFPEFVAQEDMKYPIQDLSGKSLFCLICTLNAQNPRFRGGSYLDFHLPLVRMFLANLAIPKEAAMINKTCQFGGRFVPYFANWEKLSLICMTKSKRNKCSFKICPITCFATSRE